MASNMSWIPSTTATPYDAIIGIHSLKDLVKDGWRITVNNTTNMTSTSTSIAAYNSSLTVGMLGSYNRGKSFLLNQLCKTQFPSGRLLPTEGISITASRDTVKNLIFIDTAGTDTPVKQEGLEDKRATEALLREIVLHLCSYIIIVLNRLHLTDQIYIREVLDYCNKLQISDKPEIIFVHNLLDLENEDDVTEIITTEIYGILGAKLVTITQRLEKQDKNIDTYRSIYNGTNLLHFIMAKNGSPAGKKWNNQSLDGIVAILQADIRRRRDVRVLEETLSYVNNKLPQLFSCENDSKADVSKLQIVKHTRESYIVLSDLKDVPLEERQKHSSSLSVSPRLIYDQRGFLMGIFSEEIGKWEPRYRVYENGDFIKVFVELAGFDDTDVVVNVDKKNIFIEGKRDDFGELQYKKVSDQSEIPIGPFELKVPVQCEIENLQAKLECKGGLFTITCPKTKMTVQQLGARSNLKK